ncbi:phage holin family protein [Kushneria marisflavi]|nr:phage holin family protein [Kushneria marisflavi]RKD83931.1 putative superfamily III holin-X [Kushneria marisflavi]
MTQPSGHKDPSIEERRQAEESGGESRGMVGMLSSLLNDVTSLVRQEIALGKAEMQQNIKRAGAAIASMVVAGAVLNAGLLVLLAAAVLGLGHVIDLWLSALIVGAVVALIGMSMMKKARDTLSTQAMTPDRTVDSLQRDQSMLKEHASRHKEEENKQ